MEIILKYQPANKTYNAIKLDKLKENDFCENLLNKVILFIESLKDEHLDSANLAKEMFDGLNTEKTNLNTFKNNKIIANKFYRIQCVFENPTSNTQMLIEWPLVNLNSFKSINSGFENEITIPEDLIKLYEKNNLEFSVVFYPDFSYLGPQRCLEKKNLAEKKNDIKNPDLESKPVFILQNKEWQKWPIFINVYFSTLTEVLKDSDSTRISCIYKNTNSKKQTSTSLRVYPKLSEVTRINENYKSYFPSGAKSFLNSTNYGGIFIGLPKKNVGVGNVDPVKQKLPVKYFINPEILKGFNEESKKFENESVKFVEEDVYESMYINTDVDNLSKLAFGTGLLPRTLSPIDLSNNIEEIEVDLCKFLETQYKFDDYEQFLNVYNKTTVDLLDDQIFQIGRKKTKHEKLTVLKKCLNQRLFLDRLESTNHQTTHLITCFLTFINLDKTDKQGVKLAPQFNFELESLMNMGYSNIPF
jgi:hypothetical protein